MALAIGDEAPNFDLTSTEDVVLMLRDEVPRTSVLLYFFAATADERARRDLAALATRSRQLAERQTAVIGVSPAKLDDLKALQRELDLPFPLLEDDRGFSAHYGVTPPAEDQQPQPALVAVDRRQRVLWLANPLTSLEAAWPDLEKALTRLPSPTANYPRSVINRLVDRWIN